MRVEEKNADCCGGFLVSILIGVGVAAIGLAAMSTAAEPGDLSPVEVAALYAQQSEIAEPWPGWNNLAGYQR